MQAHRLSMKMKMSVTYFSFSNDSSLKPRFQISPGIDYFKYYMRPDILHFFWKIISATEKIKNENVYIICFYRFKVSATFRLHFLA